MLKFYPLPAFQDNYLWLLSRAGQPGAVIVDPGDAAPVIEALEQRELRLEGILLTHHHFDHTGGVDALLQRWPVPVYGPDNPAIPQVSQTLSEGDRLSVLGAPFEVLAVPGHTLDHIALFYPGTSSPPEPPALLCGDTLFAGGCGRLFEGTAEMMWESLRKLEQLPAQTRVYCAHEYTLDNLRFARAAEPGNQALEQRWHRVVSRRQQGLPTLPSTLALERATNPFLRCLEIANSTAVPPELSGAPFATSAQAFAALRAWKDHF